MSFKLIIPDIDAGGGATIDLYFDADKGKVKEEKNLAGGQFVTNTFDVEEFEEDNYGKQGQEFLDKINS